MPYSDRLRSDIDKYKNDHISGIKINILMKRNTPRRLSMVISPVKPNPCERGLSLKIAPADVTDCVPSSNVQCDHRPDEVDGPTRGTKTRPVCMHINENAKGNMLLLKIRCRFQNVG